jgi:hypothetical protein
LGERIVIEEINGENDLIDLENTNPNKRAIHIHGGMEHNLVGYAKYYSCGSTKITINNKFTRKIDHIEEIFKYIVDVRNKLYFELGTVV